MAFDQPGLPLCVYLAADFGRAADVNSLAEHLQRDGSIRVVSRWHRLRAEAEASAGMGGPADKGAAQSAAERNVADIDSCDVFVVLTTGAPSGGGRHFETGYAFAKRKRVIIAGAHEHAFHHLPGVQIVSLEELGTFLGSSPRVPT